jgi:hypothetical protein
MKNKKSRQKPAAENLSKKAKGTLNTQKPEDPELKIRKERTHNASTKPDKNHIG